jgi:hypothetical protein
MRFFVCITIIVSMLFLSFEGAIDIASQGHPHEDAAELADADAVAARLPSGDTDTEPDHCEHCCHGHVGNIVIQIPSMPFYAAAGGFAPPIVFSFRRSKAPPTPPPDV